MSTIRRVRVYNRNTVALREQHKGKDLTIEPGEFVEMGRSEAVKFRGSYHPVVKNETHGQLRDSMKIVELVPITDSGFEKSVFVCNQDGTEHPTQAKLDKYIADNFADQIVDQNFAKEFKKNKGKKTA